MNQEILIFIYILVVQIEFCEYLDPHIFADPDTEPEFTKMLRIRIISTVKNITDIPASSA